MNKLFEKIKISFINFMANISMYPCPLFILFKTYHYELKGHHIRQVLDIIQPGDILLRKYKYYITNWFIPGYFSHAAIYVGDNNIIHMLGDGIKKEDILTFTRCDDISILRMPAIIESDIKEILDEANKLYDKDVDYDYSFSSTNEKFYCSELIDKIYNGRVVYNNKISDDFVMPDDFLTSNLHKVFCSKTQKSLEHILN